MERPAVSKLSLLGLAGVAAAAAAYYLNRYTFFPLCCFASPEDTEPDHPQDADRLLKLEILQQLQSCRGIEAFGALRIPDTEGKERKEFDVVFLTKRSLYIVEVKSWSGTIKCDLDGRWCQSLEDGSLIRHGNIIQEVQKRAMLLDEYLLRRGLKLPSSFIKVMIIMGNADSRLDETIFQQSEVLSLQQLQVFLEKQTNMRITGCVKLKLHNKKRMMSKDLYNQLHSILNTAPLWDRLALKGGDVILGDFLQFDACAKDMEALKSIKRSRVSEIRIQRKGAFLKDVSQMEVKCMIRDYRKDVFGRNIEKTVNTWCTIVEGDVDIVFRCLGSSTSKAFKLDTIISIELGA